MTARAARYVRLGDEILAAHQAHAALCAERDRLHQQLTTEELRDIRLHQTRADDEPTQPGGRR